MKTTTFFLFGLISSIQIFAQYGTSAGSLSFVRQSGSANTTSVDTRSGYYSGRSQLRMPDENTFIVEDFMNYHKHKITIPDETDVAISIDYDNSLFASRDELLLQVGVATQLAEFRREKQNTVNVSLVVDISGSMSGRKIELVKKSMKDFVNSLELGNYLSIVIFDSEASVYYPSKCLDNNRNEILRLIDRISVGGFTNVNAGMVLGYREVLKNHREGVNSRVILLTDGETNRGETNHEKIFSNSLSYNKKGINISTIGVGESLDFRLLRQLADEGRGSNYFIGENAEDIEKVFDEELNSLLYEVGKKPRLTVDLPDGWTLKECFGYQPQVKTKNRITIDFSNLGASSTRIFLMKIKKSSSCEENSPVVASLEYVKDGSPVKLKEKKRFDPNIYTTNEELGKNYAIGYMAQGLKNAAHAYACRNTTEAETILEKTRSRMYHSEYSCDDDFKRVFDILKLYTRDENRCTE